MAVVVGQRFYDGVGSHFVESPVSIEIVNLLSMIEPGIITINSNLANAILGEKYSNLVNKLYLTSQFYWVSRHAYIHRVR